ncbi:hypothetical protein HYU06_03390 [Candidatus Woesearchaeota archaeon]|nr:hypothetical protein [Candidatus Woesearchaeota archaeon]
MLIVVDVNIVISALTAGNIADLILSEKLELISPELLFVELRKHKEEIKQKSLFSEQEFERVTSILEAKIKIIPLEEFAHLISQAEQLLGKHVKDSPYVALALKYKCPIWSYEKLFKKLGSVECLITQEVAERIKQI